MEINSHLDGLLRRNEVGDTVSFVAFGREVFKQVESLEDDGTSPYRRADAPNNNRRYIDAYKKSMAESATKSKSQADLTRGRLTEQDCEERLLAQEFRHVGGKYI